jgi:hypothetical protein
MKEKNVEKYRKTALIGFNIVKDPENLHLVPARSVIGFSVRPMVY